MANKKYNHNLWWRSSWECCPNRLNWRMISLVDKMKASQKIMLEGLTEYFEKDENNVGSEERSRLIGVLDRMIEESENSDKVVSLRSMLLDIDNSDEDY
ncbi:unnamed protein product [Blepharisma stoltei]|uniref:Uncharacterized protein n=1 Tax=Blepharisma stoltei TaxID=1481888 RepID=A0AAU9JAY3_9CILI|nr:unnamed protein product [Blepharisma stoltei]